MSHRARQLIGGSEDVSFFPEIADERTTYESPLTKILLELRRKHVVAASATRGPHMSLPESVLENDDQPFKTETCTCRVPARQSVPHGQLGSTRLSSTLLGRASFGRVESVVNLLSKDKRTGVCSVCGKKLPFDPIGEAMLASRKKPFQRRTSAVDMTRRYRPALGPPLHAEALLKSTPHLRHLSSASMDMQGAGNAAKSRGFLGLALPSSKPSPNAMNSGEPGQILDYRTCLVRNKANQKAASELASFLWVLAHEMSLEDYLSVENEVFTSIFSLVHAHDNARRMAGVAALDALIDAPSADEDKKAIKFTGALSSGLRAPHADYNFLAAVAKALGHLATRAANVDSVEAEITRALEWLRTERSDRRLAACLVLKELAINAPTAFYAKTAAAPSAEANVGQGGSNEFLKHIFPVILDPQPIVRACAADALSRCLKILMQRKQVSLTRSLWKICKGMMKGLEYNNANKRGQSFQATQRKEAAQHGSLLTVSCMIEYTGDFMLPRYDAVCTAVLKLAEHPKAVIQLEVVRLIPRLARRCPGVFGRRNYLDQSLAFLMQSAASPPPPRVGVDIRPAAFTSLGQLILAMNDPVSGTVIGADAKPTVKILRNMNQAESEPVHVIQMEESGIIYQKLEEIFDLVRLGLRRSRPGTLSRSIGADTRNAALNCSADLVEALGDIADLLIPGLINDIFESGLSEDLIHCLHSIAGCVPSQQNVIEDRLLQEVSLCLAGTPSAAAICDPLVPFEPSFASGELYRAQENPVSRQRMGTDPDTETPTRVTINMSNRPELVTRLVLSLYTLGSFGDEDGMVTTSGTVVPLLPFVHHVTAHYLSHPSTEVRRAAALTCCNLLVPTQKYGLATSLDQAETPSQTNSILKIAIGTDTSRIIEDVMRKLLRVAVSDPSPIVRLCVVRALDSRYDPFLSQQHHLQGLFLLLQDEALATRAAGLKLLGRLTRINPAPILPNMRRFLVDLVTEMRCGGDKRRGREEATRLIITFLRAEAFRRLVQPLLSSILDSLPLTGVAPRLASAALVALGVLAQAAGSSLRPWVKKLIPHILETMQDQSSASKQLTSLKTLGQIAASTGYVITPYREFPQLLSQAADVLPATKRAPWALRREVIRTLGMLGALDPDQYHTFVPTTRKRGAVGGGYFVEADSADIASEGAAKQSEPQHFKDESRTRPTQNSSSSVLEKTSSLTRENSAGSLLVPGTSVKEADDGMPASNYMYEQYAMVAQPVFHLPPERRMTPADEDFYPTVTIQALIRIFKDPSLAVHHAMVLQAIMFIFKDLRLRCVPYLKKVVPPMIFTIRTCGPYTLREALLKELAVLSDIVKEHLRPYISDIFDVLDDFWSSRHLGTILHLVAKIAVGVPDEFKKYVPRLVQKLLGALAAIQASDWLMPFSRNEVPGSASLEVETLELILNSIRNLGDVLGDYLHILIPTLLKLAESLVSPSSTALGGNGVTHSTITDVAVLTFQTLSFLLAHENFAASAKTFSVSWGGQYIDAYPSGSALAARAIQPLVRLLGDSANVNRVVGLEIVKALCICAEQLGYRRWKSLYHEVTLSAIRDWQLRVGIDTPAVAGPTPAKDSAQVISRQPAPLQMYDELLRSLKTASRHQTGSSVLTSSLPRSARPPDSPMGVSDQSEFRRSTLAAGSSNSFEPLDSSAQTVRSRKQVNQANLQLAWDVSQKVSREDWDEWMRRFAIELLRESPSTALRATASLAHAYQPLARELFSAAFVCCWETLSEDYRASLVYALETAFSADVSPEILQTLLTLAEFMEHEGVENGLPIDISILADLSLTCRAYAKALHYKEREYNMGGASGSCVEALISINNKLDLPDAALGVLKAARIHHDSSRLQYAGCGFYDYEPALGNEPLSSHFLHHYQTRDMLYSVLASTEDAFVENEGEAFFEIQESWLAKLGSWSEALAVYEDKLSQNPYDFDAILGSMSCLDATGEWQRVLDLAEKSWVALSGDSDLSEFAADESAPYSFSSMYITPREQRKALKYCAQAAWRLGQWEELEKYASRLVLGAYALSSMQASGPIPATGDGTSDSSLPLIDFDGAFYTAVLHIHRKEWSLAAEAIDAARMAMDSRFTALLAESYKRAYPSMVTAQTLAEMEEIIAYLQLEERSAAAANRHPLNRPDKGRAREALLSIWRDRLAGCRVDADVYSSILAVRSLVLSPKDGVEGTLVLSDLSRQAHRYKLAERVLLDPLASLGADLNGPVFGFSAPDSLGLGQAIGTSDGSEFNLPLIDRLVSSDGGSFRTKYFGHHERYSKKLLQEAGGLENLNLQHRLYFSYVRHLWATEQREEAMYRLSHLCNVVDLVSQCEQEQDESLKVACWLELGEWRLEETSTPESYIPEDLQVDVLRAFKRAISSSAPGYRAWHSWALLNFRIAQQLSESDESFPGRPRSSSRSLRNHVVVAVKGFVNAISVGTKRWSASVQQDMLNLLTCLLKYGELSGVAQEIKEGLGTITLEAWLGVLPQLLARIHIRTLSVRSVLHPLLVRLGERHPQALIYPLSVLMKGPLPERRKAAESLMDSLKEHSSALVEEALMVSSELIRVAILWLETWHGALDEASRLYYVEGNVQGMLDLLTPLHEKIEGGGETLREKEFLRSFGSELAQAHEYTKEYVRILEENQMPVPCQGGAESAREYDPSGSNPQADIQLNKAWDIYYQVFRRINKHLASLTKMELSHCSPALSRAYNLELGIPGSYRVDGSYTKIEYFVSKIDVITSKQRPRKISLRGSDGKDYVYVLKGHEDLRQDERVMQLFGLVNALLARDRQTKKHDLNIQRYTISPLSHDCGLVNWVPHCDTFHSLIRDYRQARKIPLNMEHREMFKTAPDYELLTVMQKVEVFSDGLSRSVGKGNDLYEILWLQSTNSEEWLDRRTKYTQSLAVMSMVGYILGLGDRHPSNLMLDHPSGRVLHVDFGDCFEVAMHRENMPEKIPFRLTRMLVKAMEVSGIEGSYRSTCERTMTVLRDNRDSLVAMLEAFVYDPLVSWRLVGLAPKGELSGDIPLDKVEQTAVVDKNGLEETLRRPLVHQESIPEGTDEDEDESEDVPMPLDLGRDLATAGASLSERVLAVSLQAQRAVDSTGMSAAQARSLKMYSNMQAEMADMYTSSRIASIAGNESGGVAAEGSMAQSRMARSLQQREVMSLLEGESGEAHEEALNEKALKVIRRVQDKLSGTDFCDVEDTREPLDVPDQVGRLIVQATSTENLCQLFVGMAAFW